MHITVDGGVSHPCLELTFGIDDTRSCSEDLPSDSAAGSKDAGPEEDQYVLRNFAVASAGRLEAEGLFQNISLRLSVSDDPNGILEVRARLCGRLLLVCWQRVEGLIRGYSYRRLASISQILALFL